ncbi:MAG: hypothetical protein P8R54_22280 [Myxococcota bacterium]|nr:hypothetical protein [Myxococcota bacterium]
MTWPAAFALTLLLEIPVVLVVLGRGWRRDLPAALLANALSHPTLWFVLWPMLADVSYATALLIGEAAVFSFEALLYLGLARSLRGLSAGVAANSLSLGVGLLINELSRYGLELI